LIFWTVYPVLAVQKVVPERLQYLLIFAGMVYKISAWLLTVVFLFNTIGLLMLFISERAILLSQAELRIHEASAENEILIVVDANQESGLVWVRDGKEFRYNDLMYDVIRTEKKGDKTFYYCLDDRKDSDLFAMIDHAMGKQSDHGRSARHSHSQVVKLILSTRFISPVQLLLPFRSSTPTKHASFTSLYSFIYCREETPPPQVAVA